MSGPRGLGAALALAAALAAGAAPAAAQEQAGRLDVCAFDVAGPLPGLEVRVGAVAAGRTGRDGTLRLTAPPGQHAVRLALGGRPLGAVTVPVVWGEATELVVTVPPEGPARVDVEAPAWPRPEAGPTAGLPTARGALAGRVVDARTGAPIAGARVLVRGHQGEARSDAAGAFLLADVPAGPRAVSVIHPAFATTTVPEVVVPASGTVVVDVPLSPSSVELEVVRVQGYKLEGGLAALLSERREERAVTEVVGAEQLGKTGDGNAAEALQRVTGLSVVGGRYVYIRGMGERYVTALLDGAQLPSANPDRRVVPLDLFPANIIESITVQKTYSPDLPGEFGGGAVRIRTKGLPEALTGDLSVSSGFNDRSTLEDGLTYAGGDTDFLGVDDGTRALPFGVRIAAAHEPLVPEDPSTGEGYPLGVLTALGQTMPNTWSARRREHLPPDLGLSASLGNRHETPVGAVGWRAGLAYDDEWRNRDGVRRVFGLGADGSLEPIVDYQTERTTRSVDLTAQASVGLAPAEGHEVSVKTLLIRSATDEAEVYAGYLGNEDRQIAVTSLSWVEEQLLSTQVQGSHLLPRRLELSWSYTYALATREQPDWRRTRYDLDPAVGRYLLSNRPEGNQRLYNEVEDDDHDLSLALTLPLPLAGRGDVRLQAGGGYVVRGREAETRRFKFIHRGPRSRDPALLALPPEQAFAPENIAEDAFTFEEITRATDSYEGAQTIAAAFANVIVPLRADLELSAGVRLERSAQEVTTFDLFSRGGPASAADLDTTDWLPAASLVWRFVEGMQVRAAYGRTVVRPDFRELSTAPFDQVVGAGVAIGNPDLERTLIDHVDLRWEWYLSADEAVSAGVFYKRLQDPIEQVLLGGSTRTVTLANAAGGQDLGLELEARKRLGFLHPALRPLVLGGNLALIASEVELDDAGVATSDSRPLAGQSEWIVNASIGWDDPEERLALTLVYNVAGPRLVSVGTFGLPDVYEEPVHALDLVLSWGFTEHWGVRVQLENLLDSRVRLTQGGETTEEWRLGRTVGVSLGGKF